MQRRRNLIMKIICNAIEYTVGLAAGAAAAIGTAEMLADDMAIRYNPYANKGDGIQLCKDIAKAGIAGGAGLGTMVLTWTTIETVKQLVGLK